MSSRMHYLLDTNIFIAALKAQPAVRLRLESLPASALVLSPIVLGELQTGVEKSAQAERNLRIPTIVTAHTDERDRCSVRASVGFRV